MSNMSESGSLIELSKEISGKKVLIKCEEFLKDQGNWLLSVFEKEVADKICDDLKIQVGFTMFIFKDKGDYYEVVIPDYSKDPFKDTTENISISLILQFQLNETVKKLDVSYEDIAFDDELLLLSKARNADNIYLERSKNYGKGQSGWYIGAVNMTEENPKPEKGNGESIAVCDILKFRPDLLKLLALPKGYIITIIHNEIVEIMDGDSKIVYKKIEN